MCSQVNKKDANEINSRVEKCGECCLIHQQFTLTENIIVTAPGLIDIYNAPDNLFRNGSPFGTVIVSNCGCTPLIVRIVSAATTTTVTVPPKGQYALTGSIVEIDAGPTATTRPIPICAVFTFDLFLILPPCSAPNDLDNNIDITIGNSSSGSQSSSASSSQSAAIASTGGNISVAANSNASALTGGSSNSTVQTAAAIS